jgi:thiamine-monophosphate kinase
MSLAEFDIIDYFAKRQRSSPDVILGIGDDCALLKPPKEEILAISTDTLVEGVHFLPQASAHSLGYRSLAVSLSDLAAMGAKPSWVLLSLTLPQIDSHWLSDFSDGFFSLAEEYEIKLVGGNTSSGALTISTHVLGSVPEHAALKRSGAKAGDLIYVSGQLGGAGFALSQLLKKQKLSPVEREAYEYPKPRIFLGLALRNIATAAIDISDGLLADLQHMLKASQVGANLYLEKIPLANTIPAHLSTAYEFALNAGDDYELCFTIPANKDADLQQLAQNLNCPLTCVGQIDSNLGLRIYQTDGNLYSPSHLGYVHQWSV